MNLFGAVRLEGHDVHIKKEVVTNDDLLNAPSSRGQQGQ
jgi:hypothetical protein